MRLDLSVSTPSLSLSPQSPDPYVISVKVSSGVKLMPHRHPENRVYTVMSGVFYVDLGDQFDGDSFRPFWQEQKTATSTKSHPNLSLPHLPIVQVTREPRNPRRTMPRAKTSDLRVTLFVKLQPGPPLMEPAPAAAGCK
jgi:hypothetical protein